MTEKGPYSSGRCSCSRVPHLVTDHDEQQVTVSRETADAKITASCTCGWAGSDWTGPSGPDRATREGARHLFQAHGRDL